MFKNKNSMILTIHNLNTVKHPNYILKNGTEFFCSTKGSFKNAKLIEQAMKKIVETKEFEHPSLISILDKIKHTKMVDLRTNLSRDQDVVELRFIYCKMARELNFTLNEIGYLINRKHDSVIHAINKFEDYYKTDQNFRKLYFEIKNF